MAASLATAAGEALRGARAPHAGLVVGVARGEEAGLWHRGRLPDGARSLFEIGSVTKVFTCLLLADLARERLVGLDDPVQRHLPPGATLPVRGRPISLTDLATHRSGLPRLPRGMLLPALTRDRRDPYAGWDDERLRAAAARTRPRRAPGGRPAYSNYGMGLLGWALAHRAGTSYDALVRARYCEPLGLGDTWVEPPPAAAGRLAAGHTRRGRPTPPWRLAALAGAGGLCSTAEDLLRFGLLFARGAEGPLAQAARETRRPRARWGRASIGLGWLVLPPGGPVPWRRLPAEVLVHEGGTGGFRSLLAVMPERRIAVAVLASQARSAGPLGLRVLRAVAE